MLRNGFSRLFLSINLLALMGYATSNHALIFKTVLSHSFSSTGREQPQPLLGYNKIFVYPEKTKLPSSIKSFEVRFYRHLVGLEL